MPSIADDLADRFTAHAIDLERVKEDVRRKILRELKSLERNIVARLQEENEKAALGQPGVLSKRKRQRLETLLEQTNATIASTYKSVNAASVAEFEKLVKAESIFTRNATNAAIGVDLASVALSEAQLKAVVDDDLIQGAPLKDWWSRQAGDVQARFAREMRLGFLQGESVPELTRRVTGAVDPETGLRTGGIKELWNRRAETLVRTSAQSMANAARNEVYRQNSDVVKALQWLATLDSRTCLVAGTPIATPDGDRPIEQIGPGDTVIGGSGKPRRVVSTKHTVTKKIAVVRLSNGAVIRCTPDHLFLCDDQIWREAQELRPGEKLAEALKMV